MRAFYMGYPILDALRRELTWTHYRILLRVGKPAATASYINAYREMREQPLPERGRKLSCRQIVDNWRTAHLTF